MRDGNLWMKDRSLVSPLQAEDVFIYEALTYAVIDKTIFQLQDKRHIKTNSYFTEGIISETKNSLVFLDLIAASERWLRNNGYTEVPEDINVKKRFKK